MSEEKAVDPKGRIDEVDPKGRIDEVDPEREWREKVYRPGVPQLTARAVVAGMLIGSVMCLSNLFVVLKTGWSLGVTVTSVILAFALFSLVEKLGLTKNHFSILENNAMGSVASAAGYMTGGGNMAAVPALFMLTGMLPTAPWLFVWFAMIAALGVFAAIPIKRQLINIEKIPFPSGIATAETLNSLHAMDGSGKDGGEGSKKARWLAIAGVFGAMVAVLRDVKLLPWNLPKDFHLPFGWRGHKASDWSMGVEGSLLLMGAGAIIGFRVCASMMLGSILCYGFVGPAMLERGVITGVGYKAILQFTLWPAAALLIASGLLSFSFQWRSVVKSFTGLTRIFSKTKDGDADEMAGIECPDWWFPAGFLVLGPVVVFLMSYLFGIPWWAGIIALPMAMAMGVVAARVTGETDITPTKALGPATQIVYGAVVPGNLAANIMGANVTGGVGLHAADLLTDLKSGYLVGANPRQQFKAQLFGVLAGAAVVVPAFNLLIPEASVLGSKEFPAPAVQVWAGVSKALVDGVGSLPYEARVAAGIGAVVGIVLTLLERFAPKKVATWVPSPSGLGIAFMIPGANAISMFLGAAIAEVVKRFKPQMVTPAASGLIAGESLMGIAIAILIATGVLSK